MNSFIRARRPRPRDPLCSTLPAQSKQAHRLLGTWLPLNPPPHTPTHTHTHTSTHTHTHKNTHTHTQVCVYKHVDSEADMDNYGSTGNINAEQKHISIVLSKHNLRSSTGYHRFNRKWV